MLLGVVVAEMNESASWPSRHSQRGQGDREQQEMANRMLSADRCVGTGRSSLFWWGWAGEMARKRPELNLGGSLAPAVKDCTV